MRTYQRSGGLSGRLFLFVPLALPVFAALGAGLHFVQTLIPIVGADVLLLLMGAVLSAIASIWILKWSHCRNALVGFIAGLLFGACVFVGDFAFEYLLVTFDQGSIGVVEWIRGRIEQGYGVSGRRGDGAIWLTERYVVAIWAVQLLVLCVGGGLGGWQGTSEPYCEDCGEWCDREFRYTYPGPDGHVVERVESATTIGDVVQLEGETGTGPPTIDLLYEIQECPSCDRSGYLDVTYREFPADPRQVEVEPHREDILHHEIEIDPEHRQLLSQQLGTPA